jgi:CHAT domain-containing protein
VQRQLGDDEAIIEYWTDENELFSWVMRREDVVFTRHAVTRNQLSDSAHRFAGSIERGEAVDEVAGSALHRYVVAPIEPGLDGLTRLTIVADEPIASTPFNALRDARGVYLIERFAFANAPSAAAFAASRATSLERFSSVMVLANPVARKPLAPLDVRSEIAGARKMRTAAVYEGLDATARVLRSSASGYDVLHIAAHGFEDRYSGEPVLAFTPDGAHDDGLLLASEAEQLVLRRGALVVLAACRTASGRNSFEGTRSLGRAFLGAGAGSVVAALWDVEDSASGLLFSEFYTELARGIPPSDALRVAQLKALKAPGNHPRSWAAFQTYGGQ